MSEQYIAELERVLGELLEFFDPTEPTYCVEDNDGGLSYISEDMATVVDRANDLLYGESSDE